MPDIVRVKKAPNGLTGSTHDLGAPCPKLVRKWRSLEDPRYIDDAQYPDNKAQLNQPVLPTRSPEATEQAHDFPGVYEELRATVLTSPHHEFNCFIKGFHNPFYGCLSHPSVQGKRYRSSEGLTRMRTISSKLLVCGLGPNRICPQCTFDSIATHRSNHRIPVDRRIEKNSVRLPRMSCIRQHGGYGYFGDRGQEGRVSFSDF